MEMREDPYQIYAAISHSCLRATFCRLGENFEVKLKEVKGEEKFPDEKSLLKIEITFNVFN